MASSLKIETVEETVNPAAVRESTEMSHVSQAEQSSSAQSSETKQSMRSPVVRTSHNALKPTLRDIYTLIKLSEGEQPIMPCETLIRLKLIGKHNSNQYAVTEKGSVFLDALLEVKMPKPKWGY